MSRGGPPRKYRVRVLEIGERERVANPPRQFRIYVCQCAEILGRRFSVNKQPDGSMLVTRVA